MDTVFASLVAVVGTLIGSLSTYVFQRRTAERAEVLARAEHVRQELLAAYGGYAAAVTDLKRTKITMWFRGRHHARDEEPLREAFLESDRLGAAAETAAFRLQLVASDAALYPLMDAISGKLDEISHASDRQALIAIETEFEAAVRAFVETAADRLH
ncbi:hypothetical protein [Streptomyces sp. NPDC048340]|uniref:hypothetical protein n=1 Tax=Streptomyces sp. NPDC048340 TaxID=3365537 RepID=UPI0037123542